MVISRSSSPLLSIDRRIGLTPVHIIGILIEPNIDKESCSVLIYNSMTFISSCNPLSFANPNIFTIVIIKGFAQLCQKYLNFPFSFNH